MNGRKISCAVCQYECYMYQCKGVLQGLRFLWHIRGGRDQIFRRGSRNRQSLCRWRLCTDRGVQSHSFTCFETGITGRRDPPYRAPAKCDLEYTARYADLVLHADADGLCALDAEAAKWGTAPGIILMLDVGDLREGVETISDLVELATLCESLPNLRLKGVGTNHACLNGVLPSYENLSFLVDGAEAVEEAIGRKLEWISGGSSINLLLLHEGENKMPPRVNHLRLGGSIANPMNIRLGRGVSFEGLREDSVSFAAEIVEIREKASAVKGSTKNWMGQAVKQEDKGRRLRAILAVGSQDIASAKDLIPLDEGVTVVGCSSDHTIVDVTDARELKCGDVLHFRVRYVNMLYAFSGKHVAVYYQND